MSPHLSHELQLDDRHVNLLVRCLPVRHATTPPISSMIANTSVQGRTAQCFDGRLRGRPARAGEWERSRSWRLLPPAWLGPGSQLGEARAPRALTLGRSLAEIPLFVPDIVHAPVGHGQKSQI